MQDTISAHSEYAYFVVMNVTFDDVIRASGYGCTCRFIRRMQTIWVAIIIICGHEINLWKLHILIPRAHTQGVKCRRRCCRCQHKYRQIRRSRHLSELLAQHICRIWWKTGFGTLKIGLQTSQLDFRWTVINSGIGNKISGESPCSAWIGTKNLISTYIRTFSDMSVYMNHIRYPSWPTCTLIMQGMVSVHSASVWALLQVQECTHDQPVIACIPPSKSNYIIKILWYYYWL